MAWLLIGGVFVFMASANVLLYFGAFVQWVSRNHAPPASLLLYFPALVPIVASCLIVFFARIDWIWIRVFAFAVPVFVSMPALFVAGFNLPVLLGGLVYALCVLAAFMLYSRLFPIEAREASQ